MPIHSVFACSRGGLLGITLLIPLAAHGASFDCSRATSSVEKLVCNDAELSQLDDKLALRYKEASADSSKNQSELRADQKRWLAHRNSCGDRACAKTAYVTRLSELQG